MNGQYHLINRKGNKFKFYWAPMDPSLNRCDYSKWGVAVVDLDWKTYDPRPLHLKAKPLPYDLKPFCQVLRFPIINGKEYRSTYFELKTHHILGAIRSFENGQVDYGWASG